MENEKEKQLNRRRYRFSPYDKMVFLTVGMGLILGLLLSFFSGYYFDIPVGSDTPSGEIEFERSSSYYSNTRSQIPVEFPININTATIPQLTALPGIGESKAQEIINYRLQNGNFNTIEEIKNVSGIGDKIFSNIKMSITVE